MPARTARPTGERYHGCRSSPVTGSLISDFLQRGSRAVKSPVADEDLVLSGILDLIRLRQRGARGMRTVLLPLLRTLAAAVQTRVALHLEVLASVSSSPCSTGASSGTCCGLGRDRGYLINIVGFFSITTDRNMFHEASFSQRALLPEFRLRVTHLATMVS